MRVSIDSAGRIVIPKPVREQLGLSAGQELELDAREGDIRLSVPSIEMWVEGDGTSARLVSAQPLQPIDDEAIHAARDELREERLRRW